MTGGQYFRAESAADLGDVLANLPSSLTVVTKKIDIAAQFAAGGALLAVAAVGLSLWWSRGRPRRPAVAAAGV
jgi:Ca-activated chloride channel family protein